MLFVSSKQETISIKTLFLTRLVKISVGKDVGKQIYKDISYTAGGIVDYNIFWRAIYQYVSKVLSVYVNIFVN